ncbi:MAG: dephospho-CoA kinase [Actinobacteria bacterium]|nr:MAG: dephospho-CoA kinase [Actinomycetota bacterium]
MLLVGLTGGIGAGKSTVARLLAEHGAVVIDADSIVRELQQPGTNVFRAIVDRFGSHVVAADGTLDRVRLADIVFRNDDARSALNGIVHPAVYAVMSERIAAVKDEDRVVVLDIPLLAEAGGSGGMDAVVVVEADEDMRVARVVAERGLDPEDVRARMAAQASSEQREALADVVIRNNGAVEDLEAQVADVWEQLRARLGASA